MGHHTEQSRRSRQGQGACHKLIRRVGWQFDLLCDQSQSDWKLFGQSVGQVEANFRRYTFGLG